MAFGGSAGFSFGSNNNQNQSTGTGFGGFGNNNQTSGTGTFGSNNNTGSSLFGNKPATSAFGSNTNTGSSLFGNNANNSNTASFGGSGGAFGGSSGTTFGGGTSSGGGFSGFGSNANNNTTSTFGSSQNKPLFGAGGTGTTSAFGSTNNAFGSGTALGQNAVAPAEGTNGPSFQPFTEKEPNGTTVNYQTITFMQPYQKYSLEELRLADYQHGRQFGNGQGGTGAFGQSNFGSTNTGSAFGGGSTGTSLFGAAATSAPAFGSNTATSGAFGSSTGTGNSLFGNQNNKPGGLFGAQQSSAPASNSLFGSASNTGTTGGTFGSFGSNNNQQQSGSLFGNTQNKPAGGLFGSTGTTTNATGFSFGQQNNSQQSGATTGGLFGAASNNTGTGGGLFGQNNNQQNTTGGSLFGNTANNNTQSGGMFGNKTGGAFGTSTSTPNQTGSLFGNTNNASAGGGLFSQNNNQQSSTGGGLFGGNNTSNQSGGLFGAQNKPAGGGLFGNTNTNTGGGLFNTSTNNNQGGGLFSGANNNTNQQQSSGSLFGNTQNKPAGGLFGSAGTSTGGGMFGNTSTNNNQQNGGLFGNSMNSGLLGASQNNQQQQNPNQQEVKHASLLDPNPYGQSSIWTGLPAPTDQNSKPVFTPLTATKKLEESKMKPLPSLRLNQSRYNTPPRRTGGYGLSNSTYGTPSSAASTPGAGPLSGSMYGSRGWSGGSFGRSFNRSASVQNLRSQYASDSDDIWKPNAFAPSQRNSGGSIKRLTIDRSIRSDLFTNPARMPALPAPRPATNGDSSTAPAQQTDGNPEPARKMSKRVSFDNNVQESSLNGETGALQRIEDSDPEPQMSTRNGPSGNGLQAVPEERESHQVSEKPVKPNTNEDSKDDGYWMKPSRQEISKMPKDRLQSFKGFQVGHRDYGFVTFDDPVNLRTVDLDNLYGNIVVIVNRSIAVYPDNVEKPARGTGLNVPSTLVLYNSWPRNRGKIVHETNGPRVDKHIRALQNTRDTEFIAYDRESAVWTFKVQHYTRYGLDDDDDDEEEESMMDQSELSLPPQSIDKSADASVMEVVVNSDSDDGDDTFAFKKSVPGQYGQQSIIPADEETETRSPVQEPHSDGSEHSAYSEDDMMSDDEQSPPMPGSLPPTNPFLFSPQKSPSKATAPGTPGKPLLDLEGDWAEQLQRTISPRKQNRDVLREAQSKMLLDKAFSPIKPKAAPQVNFRSSIDIMNSMFQPTKKSNKAAEPDFEFPYSKRSKTFHPDDEEMNEQDRQWHESFKPSFTNDGQIIYRTSKPKKYVNWKALPVVGNGKDVVVMGQHAGEKNFDLEAALASSDITLEKSIPAIRHRAIPFSQLGSTVNDKEVAEVYNLAHVLFDDYEDEFTHGLSSPLQKEFMHRIRKDRLTKFLANRVALSSLDAAGNDAIKEAVLRLTAHDIPGACELLKQGRNYRIMLLVAQLDGADQTFMDDVKHQIDAWREQKSLSEFDLDIRALYEICAGNVAVSQGRKGRSVPVEDRAETFAISTRYNLDWLQCFALGLFYGKQEKDNDEGVARIEDAVREYQGRCNRGEEPVKPAENDVMWSLLKLYASGEAEEVEVSSFPAALEGLTKPWNHSDLFTFYQTIKVNLDVNTDAAKADDLCETLASELSGQGDIASAIYALLHVSNVSTRQSQVQSFLDRFAGSLPGPDTATSDAGIQLWQRLTMDLKIPQSWIYMSKARFAASSTNNGGDNISELKYLVAAETWEDAHECLLKRVAPGFVVDEDWHTLMEMCGLFGDEPARKVSGWYDGGNVYLAFAQLMTGMIGKTDGSVIASLRKKLVTMGKTAKDLKGQKVQLGRLSQHELDEHVAIREMANALARLAGQGGNVGSLEEILELPVTQDVRDSLTMGMNGTGPASDKRKKVQGLGLQSQDDMEMDEGDGAAA
ncbi:hypothetical protein OHC33_000468 [Knufia fluminis]|uniref:Peptidase S59 domain-containing protein n=1 Tax=Knufia fluminis TaxID=191047 RepID=A0AAN8ICI9_9EURO|nr:hypothetical protein OHC33_000468 [Knufia fluminis]